MREAVERAGMLGKRIAGETQLSFISEPEAAALATLSEMDGRADVKVRVNLLRSCYLRSAFIFYL